jgi:hypothetical protein
MTSPKGKGKVHPRTGHKGPEGEHRYSYTLYLTSVLEGVSGQHHAPAALPLERDPVPIVQEARWAPGRSGRVRKISPSPEFDPQTFQPVASRYTD